MKPAVLAALVAALIIPASSSALATGRIVRDAPTAAATTPATAHETATAAATAHPTASATTPGGSNHAPATTPTGPAHAAPTPTGPGRPAATTSTSPGESIVSTLSSGPAVVAPGVLFRPTALNRPPPYHLRTPNQVIAIAARIPSIAAAIRANRGAYPVAYEKGPAQWQVSYFSPAGKEVAQVLIDDQTARVREAWTSFWVAWTMARGYSGAFGRRVNALYVWIPLSLLFLAPFFDRRRPWRLLHLDLLVLWSFSISLAYFNHADIYQSVPTSYPPMVYLLGRMLWIGLRRRARSPGPLRLAVPVPWLTVGLVFLIGFRIALNVTDSNVIDVGYAGVIGAQKIIDGQPLYGAFPTDNPRGDTYGPVSYLAYVPFVESFGFSGRWDDLPAAHAASIVFDLCCIGLLFLIGRMIRGPTLGVALAYAWAAFPFTLFAAESNTNDALVAALLLATLLFAGSPPGRGLLGALTGLTKFAPLALAPLLATHGLQDEPSRRRRARGLALFGLAFLLTAALVSIPALDHDSLSLIYQRTISYQATRPAPFSVWGLYGGLGWEQSAVQVAGVILALGLAVVPRRADLIGLAALCAAILIAIELGVTYWFYLYIPWFFAPVMIALLGRHGDDPRPGADARSQPAARDLSLELLAAPAG
ncbi:MAG TPA: hypothetical protein VHW26_11360 [Solirubrobacteraceae bacterium]|nr:hypothetical protein [Solirubrobacteraceae bacterium]